MRWRWHSTQLSLHYPGWDEERLCRHWRSIADFDGAPVELSDLMANKCFEKFDAFVPPALLNAANARDRLDVTGTSTVAAAYLRGREAPFADGMPPGPK